MSRLSKRLLMAAGRPDYQQVILTDGPYAYWRLNEMSGAVAADSSGNNRDGTYVAPVSLAAGANLLPTSANTRYLLLTGGGSGYVDVSAANQFCAGTDWSLECWISVISFSQSVSNLGCTIMASLSAPGGTTGWAIGASASPVGSLMYYTKNFSNRGVNCTVPLGRQYFAAVCTGANQTLAVYLNGRLIGSQRGGPAMAPLVEPGLYVGAASNIAGTLDGTIGEFAVYNSALSADQILRHYSAGMGQTPAFTGVLDRLTASAAGAWSLRRLSSHYAGPCINVRRDSDSAVRDIGFTPAGDPDLTTLLAFVGSANGYVAAWYDQSGNGASLVQSAAAAQPQIVNAGLLLTLQPQVNKPVVVTNGGSSGSNGQTMVTGTVNAPVASLTFAQPFSRASVFGLPGGLSPQYGNPVLLSSHSDNPTELYTTGTSQFDMYAYDPTGGGGNGFTAVTGAVTGSTGVLLETFNQASSSGVYNGTTKTGTVGANGSDSLQIGGLGTVRNIAAAYGEILIFPQTLSSADQNTLNVSQRAYWGTP
ncbi:hypothetical protein HDG34_003142 [Paraburkholderia sp. HC6.4b]|uniref:LamG domain-containing protein n=1 Tax=unclassified Paraburkholderia TaxID=2615204 RepID=UPI00161B51D8|nr:MULTISPECIES: LamG domain-containing protein [unclassified Paraburkholderia]MBB5409201.1 hypothetical protein [Paraburkholderia sp. HC6.4b]MBB5450929.1 hypothetical protein [Paraburkholderia sp. Kb1A]